MKKIVTYYLYLFIFLFIAIASSQDAQSLKDKIYTSIYEASPCVMILDKTGSYGCTSSSGGDIGALHLIEDDETYDDFINNTPKDKRILVLEPLYFDITHVDAMLKTKKVSGILVLDGAPPVSGFSPDSPFPQKEWGLHSNSTFQWNPIGDSMAFQNYPIPMFGLYGASSVQLRQQASHNKLNNHKYPRWGAQLDTFMFSAHNSEVCMRRGQCLPIGGRSVWSSLGDVDPSKPTIFAMAQLDSNAFFHDLAFGGDANMAGVVALLSSMVAIAELRLNYTAFPNQLVFGFWGSESFGYSGSRRFVKDIINFECQSYSGSGCENPYEPSLDFTKIKLNNIKSIIEVNQIGYPQVTSVSQPPSLFLHQEKNSISQNLLNSIVNISNTYPSNFPWTNSTVKLTPVPFNSPTPGIPPSSSMTFLMANSSIPTVVLTDHIAEYNNNYYHSRFDNGYNISINSLCATASLLTRTFLLLALEGNPLPFTTPNTTKIENIGVDCSLLQTLFDCVTDDFSCPLIEEILAGIQVGSVPTQYTGVYGFSDGTLIIPPTTKFVHDFLFFVTATGKTSKECTSSNDCDSNTVCIKGYCSTSTTHFHSALSPGFGFDVNKGWVVTDPSQPLWTESNWDYTTLDLFLQDSPVNEGFFLAFGIVVFIGSFIGVFFLKKHFVSHYKLA